MWTLCFVLNFFYSYFVCFCQGETYVTFKCPRCQTMASVDSMSCQQNREAMENLRCIHSVVFHDTDWRTIWEIPDLDDHVQSYSFFSSPELKIQKLCHDNLLLCATQTTGIVSLLYTVTAKQKNSFCTLCPSTKCKCFRMYSKEKQDRSSGTLDG